MTGRQPLQPLLRLHDWHRVHLALLRTVDRIKNVCEGDRAGAVRHLRKVTRPGKRLHLSLQFGYIGFGLSEHRQSILDILYRSKHRLAIEREGLCVGAPSLPYPRVDLSKVKQSPTQAGRAYGLKGLGSEEMSRVQTIEPKSASQRHLGIVTGDRRADSFIGSRKASLCCDDIGSATEHIGGLPVVRYRRDRRDLTRFLQFTRVRAGLDTHENVQPI